MRDEAEVWASGASYEPYVGRWSRLLAREFVRWLAVPPGKRWLEVGCGTGALTATLAELTGPAAVTATDRSGGYVRFAHGQLRDPRVHFVVAEAACLPARSGTMDAAVAGLVLNFLPDPAAGLAEMARVVRPGGTAATYVWDYAGRMELMRYFWDAAVELDPTAAELDEGRRFPLCEPGALAALRERLRERLPAGPDGRIELVARAWAVRGRCG